MKKYNLKLIIQMYNTCSTHLTCDNCPYNNPKGNKNKRCPGRDIIKARYLLRHELIAAQNSRKSLREDRDLFRDQFNVTEAKYLELYTKFNNKPQLWVVSTHENFKEYAAYTVDCNVFWDVPDSPLDHLSITVIAPNNYDAEDYAKEWLKSGKSGYNIKDVVKATAKRDTSVIIKGEVY
jgi:hypothetical protein